MDSRQIIKVIITMCCGKRNERCPSTNTWRLYYRSSWPMGT